MLTTTFAPSHVFGCYVQDKTLDTISLNNRAYSWVMGF